MTGLVFAIAGLALGHVLRRFTPAFLGLKNRDLPFTLPWLEVLTALVFWALFQRLGAAAAQLKWFVFALFLLAVTATDLLTKYIPSLVCWLGALIGVVASAVFPDDILDFLGHFHLLQMLGAPLFQAHLCGLILGLLGALMGYAQMEFIRRVFHSLLGMEAMGRGDALLMMMAGAFLGPQMILFALLPACFLGVCVGMFWKLVYKVPHFPFGPSLAMGALLLLLFGEHFISALAVFQNSLFHLPQWVLLTFSLALVGLLVVLIFRLRTKAAEYERMIEEDYKNTDEKIQA